MSKLNNKNEQTCVYKFVAINRNSKSFKGGRRFSFSVYIVAGDQNGKVYFGGPYKGRTPDEAKAKAIGDSAKKLKKIYLKDGGRTIHYRMEGKYGASKIVLRPAPPGTGIIAGGAVRSLCEVAGIKDVVIKNIASRNPVTSIKAAMACLRSSRSPRNIAAARGKKVAEIFGEVATAHEENSVASAA